MTLALFNFIGIIFNVVSISIFSANVWNLMAIVCFAISSFLSESNKGDKNNG